MSKIKAVIFDWAGTTIDYGCFAPVQGFIDGFKAIGYNITSSIARGPMGLPKLDHVRAIAKMLGSDITEEEILRAYDTFEKNLLSNISDYCELKDYVLETVKALREMGIKIGATTGYTAAMMEFVYEAAKKQGYKPDYSITPDQVHLGRPYPYMIWENMIDFRISDPREVVKIGDTVVDIQEGKNANCWTVGVVMGSSELGLSREEVAALSNAQLEKKIAFARAAFYQAGADYIILDLPELKGVIEDINRKLLQRETHKLLTPGPLSTRQAVKGAMLTDHCTWDDEYKMITRDIMNDITAIAANDDYATVLLQGSGSYAVEAMVNCLTKWDEHILFLVNGEYGKRMLKIAKCSAKDFSSISFDEIEPIDITVLERILNENEEIRTVVLVHCETTTGVINPLEDIVLLAKSYGKKVFVDAMSSFGAYEMDLASLGVDALAASANKCLEGLPGLSFVIAKKELLLQSEGVSLSHSLDLYDQYLDLYEGRGKFRFTSPTNIVLALRQALEEYKKEGGLSARRERYRKNHAVLVNGLEKLGIHPIVAPENQSYIITTFDLKDIDFDDLYNYLKERGFIIYPGKLTQKPTFRIGNIGDVYPSDMEELIEVFAEYLNQ